MLKNKVVLTMLLVTTVAFAIVPVSMRMRGLNPDLVGIVDDEYSDLFFNPAYINRIEGSRVYTNLSNLHYDGEDMFFNYYDYPSYYYYNLLGGITDVYGMMKLGAILETGGWDAKSTGEMNSTEIDGNETYVDTLKGEMIDKETSTALDLFWGKKMSRFDVGVLLVPQLYNYEGTTKYTGTSYYYRNDTMFEYDYEHYAETYKDKGIAFPLMAGIIMGEPEDELSVSLNLGMEKEDYLSSYLAEELEKYLQSQGKEFELSEEKGKMSGIFAGLNARKKMRKEDYSLSFLGGVSFGTYPIKVSMFDSSYSLSTYEPYNAKSEYSLFTKQEGEGSGNILAVGLGIGAEKFFDAMGTKNLFAIGFIPSFYTSCYKLKIKPETTNYNYYDNYYWYPDTLAYTAMSTSNETYDVKSCYSGFTATIPVGLETHLTDKLVLRLGVTEEFRLMYKSTYEEVMTDAGEYYTRDVTIGTALRDTTITEPSDELDSYSYKSENKVSWDNYTTYHYGLGYKINDNIELNFLNFAQLTDMRKWILGVNIKF